MLGQKNLRGVARVNLIRGKKMLNDVDEKEEEDNDQDNLKKHGVEVAHHPAGTAVVNLPDLVHEFFE